MTGSDADLLTGSDADLLTRSDADLLTRSDVIPLSQTAHTFESQLAAARALLPLIELSIAVLYSSSLGATTTFYFLWASLHQSS